MLEKNFSKKVVAFLKKNGAHVYKAEGLGKGTPDLLVCYKGKFVAIELKGDGYYGATPAQILQLKKVRESGGIACILKYQEGWEKQLMSLLSEKVSTPLQEFNWEE